MSFTKVDSILGFQWTVPQRTSVPEPVAYSVPVLGLSYLPRNTHGKMAGGAYLLIQTPASCTSNQTTGATLGPRSTIARGCAHWTSPCASQPGADASRPGRSDATPSSAESLPYVYSQRCGPHSAIVAISPEQRVGSPRQRETQREGKPQRSMITYADA